jgi:hypothetical protein
VRDKICTVSLLGTAAGLSVSVSLRVCKRRYPPKEAFVDRRGIEMCLTPRIAKERESFVLVRERPSFFFFLRLFFFYKLFLFPSRVTTEHVQTKCHPLVQGQTGMSFQL